MKFSGYILLATLVAFSLLFFCSLNPRTNVLLAGLVESINPLPAQPLQNPPEIIKAVYVTSWLAGSKNYLNYLDQLFKTTQINAVVVDVKDVSGFVSYKGSVEQVKQYRTYERRISNIDKLVNWFHQREIYVIGRITVFKDNALPKARPDLAVYDATSKSKQSWRDNSGLLWLDPASEEAQNYNILIAQDALNHGFDEINFDYIRYPSDGKLKNIAFPTGNQNIQRTVVLKNFFKKIRQTLPEAKLSVDLFGLTTISSDDLGIGQVLEDSLEYFDYVSPMLYPSHYAQGFLGYKKPAEHPYEIVKYSMDRALERRQAFATSALAAASVTDMPQKRLAVVRPWLQDFTLGTHYDTFMVKEQLRALSDATGENFKGFLLWNPLNSYSKDAILLK